MIQIISNVYLSVTENNDRNDVPALAIVANCIRIYFQGNLATTQHPEFYLNMWRRKQTVVD